MLPKHLAPRFELLCEEYVLIQAWKKTANNIRNHNSFADTLALDQITVNLPEFLGKLSNRLRSSETWENTPLRLVPAPKSQQWKIKDDEWGPCKDRKETLDHSKLRPLGHVHIEDQVVATALMLCLADRVETLQGDPRTRINTLESRKQVISYGNRLFCDERSGELCHRWGSSKLYRAYFQDYRTFLSRSKTAVESISESELEDKDVFVIQTDIVKFYDCVSPDLFRRAIQEIKQPDDDSEFFSLLHSVFNWQWNAKDKKIADKYARDSGIGNFEDVVLPQGLVASGFFANLVLLVFDDALRAKIGQEIFNEISLVDACRYVDDLRLVISVDRDRGSSSEDLKCKVFCWLDKLLGEKAPGLQLSKQKTEIGKIRRETSHLLAQSQKMNRIQSAISGGFDLQGGEDILNSILGLLRSQEKVELGKDGKLLVEPDVKDVTVARFAAWRYRKTFRSIRPLLPDADENVSEIPHAKSWNRTAADQDAKRFAYELIQRWIKDPSNVRLMRIALDLYPDSEILKYILSLLSPYITDKEESTIEQQVVWYCLSEIFRAGATETGQVPEKESLPAGICLKSYREKLYQKALYLAKLEEGVIPWYLRQQVLLYLSTYAPDCKSLPIAETSSEELQQYIKLIQFISGDQPHLTDSQYATFAVLVRRSFLNHSHILDVIRTNLKIEHLIAIAQQDPSFAFELCSDRDDLISDLPHWIRISLGLNWKNSEENTLANEVLNEQIPLKRRLRNELSLLHFSVAFLNKWKEQESKPSVITPEQITLKVDNNTNNGIKEVGVQELDFIPNEDSDDSRSLYHVPSWCKENEQWRIQLGYVLRFILSGHADFTQQVRATNWTETKEIYQPIQGHWYLRLYGLYSGQSAFGDDWLPITDWFEQFLLALLAWPGCSVPREFGWVSEGIERTREKILNRINELEEHHGSASQTLILPLRTKQPSKEIANRPLRACIIHTVFPSYDEENLNDLTLSCPETRQKHRKHLSTTLAAVDKILEVRNPDEDKGERLDWLILPELSVHPQDIRTHLLPFARAYKAMILTGLTYEEIFQREPLINSALWIIPEHSDSYGLQIRFRRQGKLHLAGNELTRNQNCKKRVQGFRPCQWLIEYPWGSEGPKSSLRFSAAICHDATDVALISDLRNQSDILVIPSMNEDVNTSEHIALEHYDHIFQYVIFANNGKYRGKNTCAPLMNSLDKKTYPTYVPLQATISFLEIETIPKYMAP